MGKIKHGLVGLALIGGVIGVESALKKTEPVCETYQGWYPKPDKSAIMYVFDPEEKGRGRKPDHILRSRENLTNELEVGENYCMEVKYSPFGGRGKITSITPEENHSQNNNSKYNSHSWGENGSSR